MSEPSKEAVEMIVNEATDYLIDTYFGTAEPWRTFKTTIRATIQSAITKACAERDEKITELEKELKFEGKISWSAQTERNSLSAQLAVTTDALEKIRAEGDSSVIGRSHFKMIEIAETALSNLPAAADVAMGAPPMEPKSPRSYPTNECPTCKTKGYSETCHTCAGQKDASTAATVLRQTWLNWLSTKADANLLKWGTQTFDTLGLAIAEETGELAQAILKFRDEWGPGKRIVEEAVDLGALCIQVLVLMEEQHGIEAIDKLGENGLSEHGSKSSSASEFSAEWEATCVHHTDAQRQAAKGKFDGKNCPVCSPTPSVERQLTARSAAEEWFSGPSRTFKTHEEAIDALTQMIVRHYERQPKPEGEK